MRRWAKWLRKSKQKDSQPRESHLLPILACIIFSVIPKANPSFDDELTAAAMVWQYIGQVVFIQHADSGRDCQDGRPDRQRNDGTVASSEISRLMV